MERMKILWRGHEVGFLIDPVPDMWYLEGILEPADSAAAIEFQKLVSSFEGRDVFNHPEKGTRIILTQDENKSEVTHALVISLTDQALFVRRVVDTQAIQWLHKNVK